MRQNQERARQMFFRDYGRRFADVEQLELGFNLKSIARQAVKLEQAAKGMNRATLDTGDFLTMPALLNEGSQRSDMALAWATNSGGFGRRLPAPRRAETAGFSKAVTAKICVATGSADAQVALLVEARLLHGLSRHPHILELVGVVSLGEPLMLLTPTMAGGTLREYLTRQRSPHNKPPLGMAEQLAMCSQVASAMVYLESLAIVHRALRVDCVLVGSGPAEVKLAGFGEWVGERWMGMGERNSSEELEGYNSARSHCSRHGARRLPVIGVHLAQGI